MAPSVFALLIGIDMYKSGDIWNLESSVHDAKRINRWLMKDLGVPAHHISMLLDDKATKQNIESTFTSHLLNNESIQQGDAIIIYYAGHGSTMPAPRDWFQGDSAFGNVELLVPFDHDTKGRNGRIAGISDRSLYAMINDLAFAKGNNITLILDTCFSPIQSRANVRDRSETRWTATTKAKPEDLIEGLWPSPQSTAWTDSMSFQSIDTTHTTFLASTAGQKAMEGKNGGRFTYELLQAFRSVSLHQTSGEDILALLEEPLGEEQQPVLVGQSTSQALFNGIPFAPDALFVPVSPLVDGSFRIELGPAHNVLVGQEIGLHRHNYSGPGNPKIHNVLVREVHQTCALATAKRAPVENEYWARIHQHSPRSFKTYLRKRKAASSPPSPDATSLSSSSISSDLKSETSQIVPETTANLRRSYSFGKLMPSHRLAWPKAHRRATAP
ncbi:caspase domain-containing protein [Mycena floridula]|nr:caspase domain-containing protein [Mycena floridula]